ncbi:MAG TPA: nuclear transport factor 2 family protein [Pseudonocardia sp.]
MATAPAARRYVDAVNRADLDALVAAFAPDGQVVDVSRRITGHDAIRRWADGEVIGGTLRVDGVTALAPDTQRLRVHWAPSGSAGWAADYTFTVRGDRVVLADLQYAR